MDTTTKLREIIEKTLDFLPEKEKKDTVRKTCQRVFQALRIDVNREFEVLYEFMEKHLPGDHEVIFPRSECLPDWFGPTDLMAAVQHPDRKSVV